MHLLNPQKASQFINTVQGERQRSAVIAIHLAWLDHSPPLGRAELLEPKTPLDLSIVYQAAAATFSERPAPVSPQDLPLGGRVMNRQRTAKKLASLPDGEPRHLATTFLSHVINLSAAAESEQDLDYYLELFLRCISDTRVIDNIWSGEISRGSDRLSDPDMW
jgi:hypothetical protein